MLGLATPFGRTPPLDFTLFNILLGLSQNDKIKLEILESRIAPLKMLADEKERALRVLEEQQRQLDDEAEIERRIFEACQLFSERLDSLSHDEKRAILAAYGAKSEVSREELPITLEISSLRTTIAQTLACSLDWRYTVVLKPESTEGRCERGFLKGQEGAPVYLG